ncbi:hypothetical protein D1632_06375 [Chryseobacterium nematophagum]|uniref:Uncharacterized protein n=2 Tax=Chryseobacterium nematophagum TaxID=2305228 RepID=A0A3M7LDM9_9FLAO|nr:hypothetical protein D1632_06375 [Chryseobacterium nematophagum]
MIADDLSAITKERVRAIDGEYEFNGYEHIHAGNKKSMETRGFGEMLDIKNPKIKDCDKVIIQSKALDKRKTYELEFKLMKNDSLKYSFKHRGTLKNGLIVLNNYTSRCHGIPFLLGGCQSFQSRIGLTRQKNLLIQDYYDNSGAALFILWAGYTINYAEKYQKIQ